MSKLIILGLIRANVQKIQSFTFTDVFFFSSKWFKCPHCNCWEQCDWLWYIQGPQKIRNRILAQFFTFFGQPVFVFMVSGDFNKDGLDQDDVDANDQWWGCSLGTGGAGTALTGWWECPHISYIELHRNIARVYFQKYFIFPWSVFVVYAISNCVTTEPGSVSFSYTILTWSAWWLQSIEKKKTTNFSSWFVLSNSMYIFSGSCSAFHP